MDNRRKLARDYLNNASLTNFMDAVTEAKITTADRAILDARFIEGKTIIQIAAECGYSPETVNRVIQKAYDKIYNILLK